MIQQINQDDTFIVKRFPTISGGWKNTLAAQEPSWNVWVVEPQ